MVRALRLAGAALFATAGLAACEGLDPVPASPTWVDDVQPILRANCFHCHGAGMRDADALRWDFFYELNDPKLAELNIPAASLPGPFNASRLLLIKSRIQPGATPDLMMPPPPATQLGDRDRRVIEAFMAVRGTRSPNQPPSAAPGKPGYFVVSDGDREQVLGKLVCGGGMEWPILGSGAHMFPAGATRPCTAWLYDGQDSVRVPLP